MANNYNKKVIEIFRNPKNMGEMKNPDAVGEVGNPNCGDVMKVFLKIGKKKINNKETEYIEDIKFLTMGCVAAIATSSITTELAKGKSLEQAKKISNKDVAEALGELPKIKMHCSNLAADALRNAIENYESNC